MAVSITDTNNPALNERLRTIIELSMWDKEFRTRLIREPMVVLNEIGVTAPEGWKVVIMEDAPNTFTFPIPAFPSET